MNLKQILEYRRAVRRYTSEALDTEKVKECLQLATLTPTSSNMQLYKMFHITDKTLLQKVAEACLGQGAATTAQQMVVFVARQDKYKERAKTLLEEGIANVHRHSPEDRWIPRIKLIKNYYAKLMPTLYARCFGLLGAVRKISAYAISLFRPILTEVSESDMRVTVHQSCGMVAQTFMLAMAEQGYDTCPLGGFDSRRLKKLLNLPSGAEINMVVSCGIRDAKGIWGDRFRVPFEEVYKAL